MLFNGVWPLISEKNRKSGWVPTWKEKHATQLFEYLISTTTKWMNKTIWMSWLLHFGPHTTSMQHFTAMQNATSARATLQHEPQECGFPPVVRIKVWLSWAEILRYWGNNTYCATTMISEAQWTNTALGRLWHVTIAIYWHHDCGLLLLHVKVAPQRACSLLWVVVLVLYVSMMSGAPWPCVFCTMPCFSASLSVSVTYMLLIHKLTE